MKDKKEVAAVWGRIGAVSLHFTLIQRIGNAKSFEGKLRMKNGQNGKMNIEKRWMSNVIAYAARIVGKEQTEAE